MAESISAEQVKKKFIDSFPDETGDLFHKLWNDVALLHFSWKSYRSLYGTSPERIKLLNYTASHFFHFLEQVLRNDVLLRITRLTDRARTGDKTNASLEYIIKKLEPYIEKESFSNILRSYKKLKISSNKVTKIRNLKIAHKDLNFALDQEQNMALGISRQEIEELLKNIRETLGEIEKYFIGTSTSHEYILTYDDAETLMFALEQARKYHEEERKRIINPK